MMDKEYEEYVEYTIAEFSELTHMSRHMLTKLDKQGLLVAHRRVSDDMTSDKKHRAKLFYTKSQLDYHI